MFQITCCTVHAIYMQVIHTPICLFVKPGTRLAVKYLYQVPDDDGTKQSMDARHLLQVCLVGQTDCQNFLSSTHIFPDVGQDFCCPVHNPISNRSLILAISRNEKDGKFHNIIQPNLYVSTNLRKEKRQHQYPTKVYSLLS